MNRPACARSPALKRVESSSACRTGPVHPGRPTNPPQLRSALPSLRLPPPSPLRSSSFTLHLHRRTGHCLVHSTCKEGIKASPPARPPAVGWDAEEEEEGRTMVDGGVTCLSQWRSLSTRPRTVAVAVAGGRGQPETRSRVSDTYSYQVGVVRCWTETRGKHLLLRRVSLPQLINKRRPVSPPL